jgi:hypothetical protein
MVLPIDFQFSQTNLQDYLDCPYRFFLRYIKRVSWPALEAEPVAENERLMQLGAQFHRLVQQQMIGISVEQLTRFTQEEALGRWWQAYLKYIPAILQGKRYPEITLSTSIQGHPLVAKYDLLLFHPEGKAILYDWKTSARKPKRQTLLIRMQTRVYPYLLVRAGAYLNQGKPILPENIEMLYWFPEAPSQPETISYDSAQLRKDEELLNTMISEIALLEEEDFRKTDEVNFCRFCSYRSWCERGIQAGWAEDPEDHDQILETGDFDFEQIAEIAF